MERPSKGPLLIILLGVVLSGLSVANFWQEVTQLETLSLPVFTLLLNVSLAAGVVYVGWWLHTSGASPAAEWQIAKWALLGSTTLVALETLLISIQVLEGRVVEEPLLGLVANGLIGLLIGSALGMLIYRIRRREEELQHENDRLDSIIKIISHDLRNPLTVAFGKLELAREECDSAHLDDIQIRLDRMETLIDETLTVSGAGEKSLEWTNLDLQKVVKHCWAGVPTGNATLQIETDRTLRADDGKLRQLLENLLRNAVEHGGQNVTVTVGDLPTGFYVEDNGQGIPADERDNVFETGYSLKEGNTGLGLVIVEQIAQAHGWEVQATTGSEGGARFDILDIENAV